MVENQETESGCQWAIFSQWREVKSGVPQGSVLQPMLFNLFINDLETGISSEVAKFADDTKHFQVVRIRRDCEELQKDLFKLGEWAVKWQMRFSIRKCKVMHIGAKNQNFSYQLMGSNGRQKSLECCGPWGHKESDTT